MYVTRPWHTCNVPHPVTVKGSPDSKSSLRFKGMALTLFGLVIFRGSESLKRHTSLSTLSELYSGWIIGS